MSSSLREETSRHTVTTDKELTLFKRYVRMCICAGLTIGSESALFMRSQQPTHHQNPLECSSSSKDFEEEVVWRTFTEFDMPGKVIRAEWDSSSPLVKIYDETNGQNNLHAKHTKFFLLHTQPLWWMATYKSLKRSFYGCMYGWCWFT